MTKTSIWAQGDIIIEKVDDVAEVNKGFIDKDPDGATVLARGEVTGHRHAFYGAGVTMFRDDALARDVPNTLYIGHVKIEVPSALKHEEHSTIALEPGTYRIRRQREYDPIEERLIAD